jgi:colanic acid/amylovoran biosynthesis protein
LLTNAITMNVGDAAILLGMLESLHDAFGGDARIEVADEAHDTVAAIYPEVSFVSPLHGANPGPSVLARSVRRRRVSAARAAAPLGDAAIRALLPPEGRAQFERMRRADAVIARGGTYLVDYYAVRRPLEELELAARTGTPTYMYSQSIGSFSDRVKVRRMRRALAGVRRVFVRDARSRAHVLELGVEEARVSVHPDAAFALARPPAGEPRGPLRVAVSVRAWRHYRSGAAAAGQAAYREAVAAAVRRLVDAGAHVVFLSTCQGRDDYWADDSRFADRLVRELLPGVPRVDVDRVFRTPREIIDELATFHAVIATRMHFAILALCAGVPVAPIAYEFKSSELFESLGWGDLVTPLEGIDAHTLGRNVEAVLERREELREAIAAVAPGLREAAGRPAAIIREDREGDS